MLSLLVLFATAALTFAADATPRQHRHVHGRSDRSIDQTINKPVKQTFEPSSNQTAIWRRVVTEAPWSARAGGALHWNWITQSFIMHGIGIYDQDDDALEEIWIGSANGKFNLVRQRTPFDPLYSSLKTMDVNGVIYRIQGTDDESNSYSNVFRSSDNGKNWTDQSIKSNMSLPGTRYLGAVVSLKSTPTTLVVFGGQKDTIGLLNDVWRSTDSGVSWRVASSNYPLAPFPPISGNSALATQVLYQGGVYDAIYQIAGYTGVDSNGDVTYSNDIWLSVDLVPSVGSRWNKLPASAPWTARENTFVGMTSTGVIIVTGGQAAQNTALSNDIWASLDGGYTWGLCAKESEFSDRIFPYVALDGDGYIWLMGGRDNNGKHLNDIWTTTSSFQNMNDVAHMCDMLVPSCGSGLKCLPNSPGFKFGTLGVTCDECPNPPVAPPTRDQETDM